MTDGVVVVNSYSVLRDAFKMC